MIASGESLSAVGTQFSSWLGRQVVVSVGSIIFGFARLRKCVYGCNNKLGNGRVI